jgi:hypothetical protein
MLATLAQATSSTSATTAVRKRRPERMLPRVLSIMGSTHMRTRAFVAG